jgi:hypothetical protein
MIDGETAVHIPILCGLYFVAISRIKELVQEKNSMRLVEIISP